MSLKAVCIFWPLAAIALVAAPLACDRAPAVAAGKGDTLIPVTLSAAKTQAVQRSVEVVGDLWGDEDVTVSAKVPGRIVSIFIDMGDRASSGQPLAQVDKTDYDLAVRQKQLAVKEQLAKLDLSEMPDQNFDPKNVPTVERARLQAQSAEAKYNRGKELTKDGSRALSQQEVDDFKTGWDVARSNFDVEVLNARSAANAARSLSAELDIASRALTDTTILAPVGMAGVNNAPSIQYAVAQRRVSVGEYVKEGTPLFHLVADDPVKLHASVPERYLSDIKIGQTVVLTVEAYDRTFEGKVSRINPQINLNNRKFEIEALVPNADRLLKPGAFVRALIQTKLEPKVVFIPQEAVISFAGTTKVFTIVEGKAVEQLIETGEHQGELVEVLSGLTGSESVVVDGASKLASGVSVAPRATAPQTSAASTVGGAEVMTLPELCIRRPVFTSMLIGLPITLGIFAYMKIGVDLFPNVDIPIVTVTTNRPGTSVEEMETGVTKLIEEAINTIAGVDELRSTTKEGTSSVTAQFVLEKNRDVAQQEVQGKINTIISRLPSNTDTPIVIKFDLDASPVMTIAISGKRSLREVTEIADKQIAQALSSLSGVGAVNIVGGRRRAINVTIDAQKLEAYHLSIDQVRQALGNQNLELPGGRVDQSSRELVLRTMGRVEDPKEFLDLIVANVDNQPLRIRDLGTSVDSWEEARGLGRLDGDNAVLLIVQKQSGTNVVDVINAVKSKLQLMQLAFGESGKSDIRMEIIRDQSRFINASLHEVKKHLILGAILVSLTILLFLRDWRTMVIASISIPVSLISTFAIMQALGFTLNNITMLALVLAVGIVIDDAVVVHENIFRWMEEKGLNAWDAAMGATREIALAVMATTFSLVVIFLPIAFMSGRTGRFFYSFGVTTAVSILMSMLVSFTMTPMLCSRFLRLSEKAKKQGAAHHSGGIYGRLVEGPYLWTLKWSMRHRWAVIVAAALVTSSLFPIPSLKYPGLVQLVGQDVIPRDDQGEFEVSITTPEGWTLDRTDRLFREVEGRLQSMPSVIHVMTTIGNTSGNSSRGQGDVTSGSIFVRLVDLNDRTFSYAQAATDALSLLAQGPGQIGHPAALWEQAKRLQKAQPGDKGFAQSSIMGATRKMMADYPDLRVSVQWPANIGSGATNADVEFTLTGPDMQRLAEYSDKIIAELRRTPGLADVDTTLALRKPELRVVVNRDRASDLGVNIQTIASTLRVLVGGEIVSDFRDNSIGELYDVWLRARGIDRNDRRAVGGLTIPSSKAGLIRLDNVATLAEARGPSQIDRFARQRKITLVANLAGIPTNVAIDRFRNAFALVKAPPDYSLLTSGRAKNQGESNAGFLMAFSFSAIFMYMILAAQFESFIHPITILMAVPITVPFAFLSLFMLGQPLTIYSILGIFLLFGIVKKNGILQVDYTNVLRRRAAEDMGVVPQAYLRPPAPKHRFGWGSFIYRLDSEKRMQLWAIMEANRTRLRPILMTTLMLIAGMIPIALGTGPGSASRASMAKVIVGGQAMSLLLSLLVTPAAYSLFDDLTLWRKNRAGRRAAAPEIKPIPDEASAVLSK